MTFKRPFRVQWSWLSAGLCLSIMSGCVAHHSVQPKQTPAANHTATSSTALIEAKPAWFGCRVDQDCQVERGVCNEVQGVNQAFLTPFRQYRDKMSQSVGCINAPIQVATGPSKCVAHRCTVTIAKPKPTH